MGSCLGYKCKCREPYDIVKGKIYDTCGCKHATATHKGPELSTEVKKTTIKRPAKVVSPVEMVLTPAEARARLRAANIPVGERGRLSPAQMAQAARL